MSINLARLHEYPVVAPDVETTGLHWYRDKMFGIAIAVYDGKTVESEYYDIREKPRVIEALNKELPRCKRIVNHHVKFDAHFMREAGIVLPLSSIECVMVRAALIDEHLISGKDGYSLDSLSRKYLGEGKADIWEEMAKLFGGAPTRSVQIKNLPRAPVSLVAKYAAPDPALALKLWLFQEQEIATQGLGRVWDLERRLTPVLARIEQRGVRVDEELAAKKAKVIEIEMTRAQKTLNHMAGKEVNTASAPQMRALFKVQKDADGNWRTDKGFMLEKTDGGEASIAKDSLIIMAEQGDERAKNVQVIRKMDRAKLFLINHIIGHAVKGRVYPHYNQTKGDNELGTGTGRLSIDDPALQQIPARDKDVAAIVRSCFLPEVGHDWLCADWEQFEFRWFAHYTEDPKILATYANDPKADFHAAVAEITGIPRNPRYAGDANAKQINLGLVFGMGEGTMAYEMGLEYTMDERGFRRAGPKAKEIFERYHSAIPGVRKLLNQASSIARKRGHIITLGGRHIRFPHGQYVHKAGGLAFQGTSADCMKLKMIELEPICEEEGAPYLLSMHDEHDISVPKTKTGRVSPRIKEVLECFDGVRSPIKCDVPILSNIGVGPNWWIASE